MGALDRLAKPQQLDPEVARERLDMIRGYDTIERNQDGSMRTWDVHKEARYTPTPEAAGPGLSTFGDIVERYKGRKVVLFGAGASTLKQELNLIDGELVVGINWTWKWFAPTFIQLVDRNPLKAMMERDAERPANFFKRTCLVYNENRRPYVQEEVEPTGMQSVMFRSNATLAHPPEEPGGIIPFGPNSLIMALSWVSWLQPERIVLLGFDFGGAHFWGDGRTEGAVCHYGLEGSMKATSIPKLRVLRDYLMIDKGIPIAHVGETALDIFPGTDRLEDAMHKDPEPFRWK